MNKFKLLLIIIIVIVLAWAAGFYLDKLITNWRKNNIGDNRIKFKVIKIIDGDTIEIENGQKVRYIGIDTPEIVDPRKRVQCYGAEASLKNKELVLDKEVYLEKDVSETDKFGRLLRYVWIKDVMINKQLVEEGFARVSTFPPDVKYKYMFLLAEEKARNEMKGLWGNQCK